MCLVHSQVSINIYIMNQSIHFPGYLISLLNPLQWLLAALKMQRTLLPGPCKFGPCLSAVSRLDPPSCDLLNSSYTDLSLMLFPLFRPLHWLLFLTANTLAPIPANHLATCLPLVKSKSYPLK